MDIHGAEMEMIKCLCPRAVWAMCWRGSRETVYVYVCVRVCVCVCPSVLISFIYSSAGRSADASERERRHGSERQRV